MKSPDLSAPFTPKFHSVTSHYHQFPMKSPMKNLQPRSNPMEIPVKFHQIPMKSPRKMPKIPRSSAPWSSTTCLRTPPATRRWSARSSRGATWKAPCSCWRRCSGSRLNPTGPPFRWNGGWSQWSQWSLWFFLVGAKKPTITNHLFIVFFWLYGELHGGGDNSQFIVVITN